MICSSRFVDHVADIFVLIIIIININIIIVIITSILRAILCLGACDVARATHLAVAQGTDGERVHGQG